MAPEADEWDIKSKNKENWQMRLKAGGQPRTRGEDQSNFLEITLEHSLAKGLTFVTCSM